MLIGRFVKIALEEEMRYHLGYDRHDRLEGKTEPGTRRTNTRNGRSRKRLRTSHGETEIEMPRDRQGSFEPAIVPKYGTITRIVEKLDPVLAEWRSRPGRAAYRGSRGR